MGGMNTPGDLLNAALKALSQPPPQPNAAPAPPNLGPDPNTGAPQANPTPGPNLNTPNLSAGAFGPAAQPTPPPAGPTKAHKLLQILQGGLQGAMAGRAASEQAVIQSGGHRSAGAGTGFTAGYELPWQHAMQGQQLEQAKAQTALTHSQSELVDTPYGKMPPALAKVIFPSIIGAQSRQAVQGMKGDTAESIQGQKGQTAQTVQGMKGDTAENVQGQKSQTAEKVANINQGSPLPLDETVANLVGIPEMAGKAVGKGTLTNINKMLEARGYKQQDLGTDGMWLIDRAGNKIKRMGDSPSLARAQARPVQVADDANPGNTKYVSGSTAINTGAAGTQSASLQVPKKAAMAEVPTKIGDLKVGFTTAVQHADLLRQAAKELKNGNVRVLNDLSNRAQTQFGDPALTNFQAIANAYNHEVTGVISKGHITDTEVKSGGATMPSNANYETIDKVLNSYKSLMQSKMNMLNQQKNAAVSGSQKGGGKPAAGNEIHYKIVNGQLVKQ